VVREPDVLKALVGVHVLVADDNPDARALFEAVLTYGGAFVTLVSTARDALAFVQENPAVDVVIADLMLPDENGYWLVREIAVASAGQLPVVALVTDRHDGPDRTLAAGFVAHLRKPVDPWELCRMVAGLARKP